VSGGGKAFATIDIGTNTTLLLVARATAAPGGVEVLAERAEITRLGRGIGTTGVLGSAGIGATLDVLREYARIAREHGATIAAIGTEGLRRAKNARDFLDPAREILGRDVEVIDGEREAALTFRAVVESFPAETSEGSVTVIDIGGGSTEIIVAERGQVRMRTSLQIGSVRLTERHVHSDPARDEELAAARAEIAAALAPVTELSSAAHTHLVGVAGTVTSLAAMAQHLASYDPARVHGFHLTRAALDAEIARLSKSTQPEREKFAGLDPRRADVILAGAVILQAIAERAGVGAILVSDRGIRWGLLYELLNPRRE
jgi:exopolyphosphatase / guanosine-5'-triphosphate,3'-diphosphate pyrophosphatase